MEQTQALDVTPQRESLATVAFIECSYAEMVASFGEPIVASNRKLWITIWHGRTFIISDGDPSATATSQDYSFMVSADDIHAGQGFALYAQDVIGATRLTTGLLPA